MKILVLSHEYPPIGGGGGQVVQDICSHLASRGHNIHVLTAHYGDLEEWDEDINMVIERVYSCRTQSFRASFKAMACYILAAIRRGLKIIRSEKPDLIHVHFAVPAGAAALVLSKLTGIPYIITIHGGDVPGGAPQKTDKWFRYVLPFTRPIWKQAARIISVSQQTRTFALRHYPVDIQVIPNGIDTEQYQPGPFDPNNMPTIIYIGRFSPEKNAVAVPEILAELLDLNWRCVMLGDGPQMDAVIDSIQERSMQGRFKLTGWVRPITVKQWLEKSDILLMPSLLDSMPIAGLQGLSAGLALVLSRIGSCPDYIDNGLNGFLVTPGDQKGYADALRQLISDKKLLGEFRQASREHARTFDLTSAIDAYEQVITEVVQK
jgi:L-malate glycosyltransferase